METSMVVFLLIAGVLGIIATAVLSSIIKGWVLSVLWGWFMVPLGAPPLSVALAIGVSIVVGLLTHQISTMKDEREWNEMLGTYAAMLLSPLVLLGIGWIVKQFV